MTKGGSELSILISHTLPNHRAAQVTHSPLECHPTHYMTSSFPSKAVHRRTRPPSRPQEQNFWTQNAQSGGLSALGPKPPLFHSSATRVSGTSAVPARCALITRKASIEGASKLSLEKCCGGDSAMAGERDFTRFTRGAPKQSLSRMVFLRRVVITCR